MNSGSKMLKTPIKEKKDEPLTVFGIKLKRNVGKRNLFAIFYVFFILSSIGGYVNM